MIKNYYYAPEVEELEIGMTTPLAASQLEAESALETYSEETYVW